MPSSILESPSSKTAYLDLLEERARRRARRSLGDFARYLAPPDYQFAWHHDLLYRYLDDFAAGRRKRVIVQMPPGHGKSEGASRNLPAYLLGRNPDHRVIACSYTADLAKEMNRDVQRVMDLPRYRALFPGTRLARATPGVGGDGARRSADKFDVVGRRGYYKCAGVGGGITGKRYDKGVIDDPIKDREAANSPTIREAIWRWFTSAFYTRQAKDAGILIVLTRWHPEDLVGRLLDRAAESPTAEQWDVLSLPAIALPGGHPEDARPVGEALWPWFRPLPELERQRELDPRDFAALYQQDPRAEGGVEWPAAYFGPGVWYHDAPPRVASVLALDPAQGKGERGCYAAYVYAALDAHGTVWVDAWLANDWDATRLADEGVELCRTLRPDVFSVETCGGQGFLLPLFEMAANRDGVTLPLHAWDPGAQQKEVRIRGLGPYLARGRLRFRAERRGVRLLVQQLRDFPVGDYVDGPDALAQAVAVLGMLVEGRRQGRPQRLGT